MTMRGGRVESVGAGGGSIRSGQFTIYSSFQKGILPGESGKTLSNSHNN